MTNVRYDLTAFASLKEDMAKSETKAATATETSAECRDIGGCSAAGIHSGAATFGCERGEIGRGEALDQMARLRGHVEHQVQYGEGFPRGVCVTRASFGTRRSVARRLDCVTGSCREK